MTPSPDLGFPSSYLQPLKTALGNAWPRPRVRRIMEDLENVQKRMTELQMRLNGLQKTPKDQRQQRGMEWMQEYKLAEAELARYMAQFQKLPVTKEQFRRPEAELSECCEAYVHECIIDAQPLDLSKREQAWKCVDCGNFCRIYKRLDREEWAKEYKEALEDRKKENEQQIVDLKKFNKEIKNQFSDASSKPLSGGYLIQ